MTPDDQKNDTGDGVLPLPKRFDSSTWIPRGKKLLGIVQAENPSRFKLFQRVLGGKANKSQCIKAFCLTCMGFDTVAVRECGDSCCPLHSHRPFQKKGDA